MIDTKVVKDATGVTDLCNTFSTENFKLRQEETGVIYGSSVIDVIAGYYENGKPYSRFTYIETDEPMPEEAEEADNG